MNFEECLAATIKSSLGDVLERMKTLGAEDRYSLLCEWGEFLFCEAADEEVWMVPSNLEVPPSSHLEAEQ